MTIEQLGKGKKLAEKIKELDEFQNAFREHCMKTVLAHSMNSEKPFRLDIETDSELYKIIDDYVSGKLSELKKQFEEI
ncbi:hypothetical protein D3Z36_15995 [Lachnospiraceae bacterium]|nr:hypothetical protein [Lachnospiraceae bacterium]